MSTTPHHPRAPHIEDDPSPALGSWMAVVLLTAAMTTLSTFESLRRYEDLRSGWSWDLA